MRNPITDLVQKRQRAQYGRFFIESCTLVAVILMLELGSGALFTPLGLKWTAAALLLIVPALAGIPMARFLAGLRREQLLDAIRITALRPEDVVDGMARSAVTAVVPTGLAVTVFLLACSMASPYVQDPGSQSPMSGWQLAPLFLWAPAMLGLTVVASYLAQCAGRPGFREAAILVVLGLGLLSTGPLWAALGSVLLVLAGLLARRASLRDVEAQKGPDEAPARQAVQARWGFRNLVMMRELARAFHQQRGSWVRLALHNAIGLPLALLGMAVALSTWFGPAIASASILLTLFVLQPLRAAWRSGVALVLEKDHGTLELLYQSPTTSQQYVDGWALAAMVPTIIEAVVALPFALWSCTTLGVGWAVTTDLGILIVLSAYLGIMMSSVAPNRTIAHRFLHFWTALYVGFGVVPIALAAFTASAANAEGNLIYPPLMGLACIGLFREWTIRRVQDDPVLTGFSPPN